MIKCPICRKEISELDESCPYCNTNFSELDENNQEVKEVYREKNRNNAKKINSSSNEREHDRTNADNLNFMANINIILSIIGAILIWINFGTTEITRKSTYFSSGYTENVANWYGIFGGIAVLIAGFTLFFLLKTIVDIYWEVEK